MEGLEEGLAAFRDGNYARAKLLLQPIAEQGNAEAQCILGNLYQLGLGVENDNAEAMVWYRKSAEQGYGIASSNLAGMLRTEADWWEQKAREQGFIAQPY